MKQRRNRVDEIIEAKRTAGESAYLWTHTSGDVMLWPSEAASVDDDGTHAIDRWQLGESDLDALIDSGECDEIA